MLPILLFALTATAQTPVSTTVLTATNISALQRYKGGLTVAHITDTMRGGWFRLTPKGSTVIDSGVNLYCANTAYVWKRDMTQSAAINIRWFGGVGAGVSSYKLDSAAIWNAIAYIRSVGGGGLYFPATPNFYGFMGQGVPLPSNIEIFGDGIASKIMHVDPSGSAGGFKGSIFFTSSYSTTTANGILQPGMANYTIYDVPKFQNYLRVQNISDTIHFPQGKFFGMGARIFGKNSDPNKLRYAEFEMNRVEKVRGDTIFLKYATNTPFESDSLPPVIIDLNSGNTHSTQLLNSPVDFATENVHIHDLTLAQANFSQITGAPYVGNTPFNCIGLGGTFESVFENLHLDGYGTFGGNLYNRCEVRNLTITSGKKMFDLGYCSANNTIHDCKWVHSNRISDTAVDKSLIYLNDGTHDIEIYNITASGDFNGNNIIQINSPVYNINIHDCTFDFPIYDDSTRATAINMSDKDTTFSFNNIDLKNLTFRLRKPTAWIRVLGGADITKRNVVLSNINFFGAAPYTTGYSSYFNHAGNVFLDNIYFQNSDTISVQYCDSSQFNMVRSPYSFFKINNFASTTFVTNSQFTNISNIGISSYNNTYLSGDTWDGTPPGGTRVATYGWSKSPTGVVNLWMNISYSVAGASNTSVDIAWPSGAPLPFERPPFNTTNDNMYNSAAKLAVGTSSRNSNSSYVFIIKTGTGTYRMNVATGTINAKTLSFQITYISQ